MTDGFVCGEQGRLESGQVVAGMGWGLAVFWGWEKKEVSYKDIECKLCVGRGWCEGPSDFFW